MLSRVFRCSFVLVACITTLSFSTLAFADDSDDDEEQDESEKPRKKVRKDSDSDSSDSDDEDSSASRRRRKSRRADPDDDDAPRKPVEAPSYSKRSGFMIQTSIATQTTAFNAGTTSIELSGIEGGLSAGYKTGRLMIGLGFDFTSFNQTAPNTIVDPDTGETRTFLVSTTNYSFVIYPELQIALLQSSDQRVELLGTVSLGLGSFGTSVEPSPGDDDITRFRVRFRVGPGIRYWVRPQLAASLTSGLYDNYMLISPPSGSGTSTATLGLYSQIGLVGTF